MAGPRSKVSHPQAGIVAVTMESFKGEELRSKQPRRLKDHRHRTEDTEPRQNPLEPNAVDLHLASLQMAGLEPTLSDIDRCRPADHGEPESHQYAHEYRVLCDTLLRTFSKRQLRRFGEMYDLDSKWTRPSRRKIDYAEAIIEQAWKWPSLSEIEKQKMDRTQIEEKCGCYVPSRLLRLLTADFCQSFPFILANCFSYSEEVCTHYYVHLNTILTGYRRRRSVADVYEVQCPHILDT